MTVYEEFYNSPTLVVLPLDSPSRLARSHLTGRYHNYMPLATVAYQLATSTIPSTEYSEYGVPFSLLVPVSEKSESVVVFIIF